MTQTAYDPIRAEQDDGAQRCYERALGRRGGEGARVVVEYRVSARGTVRGARVVEPSAGGAARRCALAAARGQRVDRAEVLRRLGERPEQTALRHTFELRAFDTAVAELVDALEGGVIGSSALQGTGGLGVLRLAPGASGLSSLGSLGGLGSVQGLGGLGTGSGQGLGGLGTGRAPGQGGGGSTQGVATARAEVQLDAPVVRGALDAAAVQRILSRERPGLRACYESALRRDPTESGTLAAQLTVDPSGRVTAAQLAPTGPVDGDLRACVAARLGRVVFPAVAGGGLAIVDATLRLTPP